MSEKRLWEELIKMGLLKKKEKIGCPPKVINV
jgi:hypothetical protein